MRPWNVLFHVLFYIMPVSTSVLFMSNISQSYLIEDGDEEKDDRGDGGSLSLGHIVCMEHNVLN